MPTSKKETYNIWIGHKEPYAYLSTVVASDMLHAMVRTIQGCGLDEDRYDPEAMTYNGIPLHRNNPKFTVPDAPYDALVTIPNMSFGEALKQLDEAQ